MIEPLRALCDLCRCPGLRRAELSLAWFLAAELAFLVALSVFAYEAGGAPAVGLVILLATLPGALAVPFASLVADRWPREAVLAATACARGLLAAAAAAAAAGQAPSELIYGLAAAGSLLSAPFRPAHGALVPLLARTAKELVAANASTTTLEAVGALAGPAAAAAALALAGPAGGLALAAVLYLAAVPPLRSIDSERLRVRASTGFREEAVGGLRAAVRNQEVRLLIALFGAQTLVRGALSVLVVVTSLELLHTGEAGVGVLSSALGVGGLAGGFVALSLVGRRGFGRPFGVGLLFWGLPIAVAGLWASPVAAILLLALVGLGNSLVDVAGLTLLQRLVSDRVLTRVLGLLESVALAAIGIGAIAAAALVATLGPRGAIVCTGAFLPLVVALAWRRLARLDQAAAVPTHALAVVRAVDLFAPLPANTVEQLARIAVPRAYPAGTRVVRQGESGDRFYILAAGKVEVTRDGRLLAVLGPGDYFGEIALLHGVARTATVTARTAVDLYVLERDDFVAAVSGGRRSSAQAEAVVRARLAALHANPMAA